MSPPTNARRYKSNLQGEVDGAALYGLAKAESDPKLAEAYAKLAAVESAHADFWKKHPTRVGAGAARVSQS
jgi:hypothetical protein